MAFPDDYSDDYPPWGRRKRLVPLRTYSGKVVYPRAHPRRFTVQDASRILSYVVPPDDAKGDWYDTVISTLRVATLAMLDKILWFLDESTVMNIYDWCIDLIDRLLKIPKEGKRRGQIARGLIVSIADRAGLSIKFID